MTTHELKSRLDSGDNLRLVHVLPEEYFHAGRIPDSLNACIYEVAFLETIHRLIPDKSTEIVVYGAGEGSLDSKVAAKSLKDDGYLNVRDYPGGLAEWKTAGFPMDGNAILEEETHPGAGIYLIDPDTSIVRWTGRNLFNHHSGTVRFAEGQFELSAEGLTGATFTIDMNSIECEDIPDRDLNALLIAHLKSADFFDVPNHPTAVFTAGSAERIASSTLGSSNFLLRGTFSMRGVSKSVELPIVAASSGPGHVTGQGHLEINRTDFGSIYGSGKFFRFLGKHVVNDHVHLHVKIHAKKA